MVFGGYPQKPEILAIFRDPHFCHFSNFPVFHAFFTFFQKRCYSVLMPPKQDFLQESHPPFQLSNLRGGGVGMWRVVTPPPHLLSGVPPSKCEVYTLPFWASIKYKYFTSALYAILRPLIL